MRTLFSRFEVQSADEDDDNEIILSRIATICWNWAKSVTSKSKDEIPDLWCVGEHTALDPKNQRNYILKVEDVLTETGRLWKLTFENRNLKDEICWNNTVFILMANEKIEFSLLQEVILPDSHFGLFEQKISPPRLIREIINDERFICNDRKSQVVIPEPSFTMNGEDIFDQVIDQTRLLPIIIMSKRFDDKLCLIDPNKIASKLTGIAKVVVIRTLNTKPFNTSFGKQWLTNGAIRIHWPKTTVERLVEEENYDNLFTLNKFNSSFEGNSNKICNHIVDLISRSTVANFVNNKYADIIRQEFLEKEEEIRIKLQDEKLQAELLDLIENEKGQISILKSVVSRMEYDYSGLRLEHSRLKDANDEQEQKMSTLALQTEKLKSELSVLKPIRHLLDEIKGIDPSLTVSDFEGAWRGLVQNTEDELESPIEEEEKFDNIHDAVIAAREDFSKYVLILDDALDASRKTKSDAKPSDVYQFFKFLYEIMKKHTQLNSNKIPSHQEIKEEYGAKYAEMEHSGTMDKYKKEFNYKGRKFLLKEDGRLKHKNKAVFELQPHMKFGSKDNPLRIHFKMIDRISKSTKFWVLKNDNWYREDTMEAKKHFLPKMPIAIVGWIGDHLPM